MNWEPNENGERSRECQQNSRESLDPRPFYTNCRQCPSCEDYVPDEQQCDPEWPLGVPE